MRHAHVDADDAGQDREAADRNRGRLVNWGELAATCVASALATLVLSRLGVAGTILGAAVTPLIITLASTLLSNEADRAREVAGQLARKDGRRRLLAPDRRRRLSAALATAAATTGILVAGITLAGTVSDQPIGDWGRDSGSGSTSGDRAPAGERATPTGTPPPDDPGSAAKRSPTPTASVRTPTPTPTEPAAPTPTGTAPSTSPTAAPSPTATP
jgi:hypothetical protein